MGIEFAAAAFVFIAVASVMTVVLRSGAQDRMVEARLRQMGRGPEPELRFQGEDLLRSGGSRLPLLRLLLANQDWANSTRISLQQAGLQIKVSEYVLLRLVLATLLGAGLLYLAGGGTSGLVAVAIGALAGFFLPAVYVYYRRTKRKAAINAQVVETLQLITNCLRSGFAFNQGVDMATKQLTSPMRDELAYYLRDCGLGARTEDALRSLVERTGSVDMEMVATIITIQRTTGGNLAEILDNVASTIRERERLQGEIRALTAQQQLTGLVLSVYPLVLGLLFFVISPSLMEVLWQTEIGQIMLACALTLQLMGALTIRQILKLEV